MAPVSLHGGCQSERPQGSRPGAVSFLGAARHPRERFRRDKYPAMFIERSLSVEGLTRNVLDQFAILLENSIIGSGKMQSVGVVSQRLVAHPANHCAALVVHHQKTNAIMEKVQILQPNKRHVRTTCGP
jgi:hypothetical protein